MYDKIRYRTHFPEFGKPGIHDTGPLLLTEITSTTTVFGAWLSNHVVTNKWDVMIHLFSWVA